MQQHISSICCASFLELRCIVSIRPCLSQSAAIRLVEAVVISHHDYSFIAAQFSQVYQQTRSFSYSGCRIMQRGSWWKKRRRDHVTPLLKELHWLPVKFCCQYEIVTLAYRHFEWSLPPYLSSSLSTYELSCFLQSTNEKLLKIPKWNLKSFRQHSFSFMSRSSLLATLRTVLTLSYFKSRLKTCLPRLSSRI